MTSTSKFWQEITNAHDESGCFVIAEVGVNHNGSVATAHELVDAAASSGARAVKFQTFDTRGLVSANAPTAGYQRDRVHLNRQQEMLDDLSLPNDVWQELADHASDLGLYFISTAFDFQSLEHLVEIGVPALKIPSGEINNTAMLLRATSYGLPLLVSTGMATLGEVDAAVKLVKDRVEFVLFHCVSAYPAPVEGSNITAIRTLSEKFGVQVGWSDHTTTSMAAVMAVAIGSRIFEKHLTLDKDQVGPDHAASADPEEFEKYVADVNLALLAAGSGIKEPTVYELENRAVARRSWHATRLLSRGRIIQPDDVIALRPGTGIPPSEDVVGLTVVSEIPPGGIIDFKDVE